MGLWTKFKEFADRVAAEERPGGGNLREDELRLAAAALLVHAAVIDGEVAREERRKLKILLQERFALGDEETRRLMREAEAREQEAVDLYRFTSVLVRASSTRTAASASSRCCGKWRWPTAWCTSSKSNLVWRAAELLGVSTRDRVHVAEGGREPQGRL